MSQPKQRHQTERGDKNNFFGVRASQTRGLSQQGETQDGGDEEQISPQETVAADLPVMQGIPQAIPQAPAHVSERSTNHPLRL
ncbi:Hypothetical predicted protein [Pelobates cultripes]|uniref:Uncharacterized protein n=1 Tax=Pelobates cultripes TaxID=61616 RepID=A0AAD1W3A2_PELCU|nr:Hypothetical predicted protein [Pelobates cultripes]